MFLVSVTDLHSLAAVPPGLLIAVGVLGALELALDVVALVVLVRTPKQRVTLPKWVWALLIVFINLIGSILFLTIGRRPASALPPGSWAPPGQRASADEVADALYGPRDDAAHGNASNPDDAPSAASDGPDLAAPRHRAAP